jgi:hypothetical protein
MPAEETKRAPKPSALRLSGSVETRSGPANQPSLLVRAEVDRYRSGAVYCCLECATAIQGAGAMLRPVAGAVTGIVLGEAVAAGAEHEIVHPKVSSARIADRPARVSTPKAAPGVPLGFKQPAPDVPRARTR